MAKLTLKQRKNLPKSDFALVQKKKMKDGTVKTVKRFPINDKEHARKALQSLSQAKHITGSEKMEVARKATKKLAQKTPLKETLKKLGPVREPKTVSLKGYLKSLSLSPPRVKVSLRGKHV